MVPLIIALAVILLLYMKIKIRITYDAKKTCIILKIGFFKFKIGAGKSKKVSDEPAKKVPDKKRTDKFKLKYRWKQIKAVLDVLKKYFKKLLIIERLHLYYRFGLGDAALTGMYAGGVYGFCFGVFGYLDHNFKIIDKKMEIIPDFNKDVQDIEFDCIFYLRLVHIITVIFTFGYVLIRNYIEFKKN